MKDTSFIKFAPNFITLLSLSSGISAIKFAFQENWNLAVLMILIAAFFDFFDGWLARKLKKSSQFGAELDSLSDFISFGVSPAVLLYLWLIQEFERVGWVFCLFYIICAALRLARFNIENLSSPSTTFYGIPSPAAAGLLLIPFFFNFIFPELLSKYYTVISIFLLCYSGVMMISRIPTLSLKSLKLSNSNSSYFVILIALIIIFLISFFWQTILALSLSYLLFSLISLLKYLLAFRKSSK
ncbi:CDP-diacylglycerol--serine O-phosphatidyltransferase [Alphaproteobacteria bacterium]|nr:CDP-diacylglycerol--serine O-phosphatidyltransferase [Alphaproteobacteria bacterium]